MAIDKTGRMAFVRALARKIDPEPEHAFQVCRYALRLFDALVKLHGYGPRERDVLEAGALLHDSGHARGLWRHHKHARDIIMEQAFPGFSTEEHRMVACVARYHRKAFPKPTHKVYADLEPGAREAVGKLAALLRIADGLDRGHMATVRDLAVRFEKHRVILTVRQRRAGGIDIRGARRKRPLFEACFDVTLEIEAPDTAAKEWREENL